MSSTQLGLFEIPSQSCPFLDLLEEDDKHCFSFQMDERYEVLAEDHPEFSQWLATVKGVGFGNISAKPTKTVKLPDFIPTITVGSKYLLEENDYPFVAVSLRDIVSPKKLSIAEDIRARFGIGEHTKVVLLSYGEDMLVESIWPKRKMIFEKIASLGFDLVTSIDYSVWLNQPHAERLINMKRGLMTFEEMQDQGIAAIPHIYWTGKKDLARWAEWIKGNKEVSFVAINLQTERDTRTGLWEDTIEEMKYFVSLLDREIHFIISGASNPDRVLQLGEVFPKLTLTNGACSRQAASGFKIREDKGKMKTDYFGEIPKNKILNMNTDFYLKLMQKNNIGKLSI